MAQHDPFTLDLFGNTSLSSGLDLGVTAFPSTLETDGDDGDAPHPPAVARIEPSADRPTSRARGETFYLAGTRGLPDLGAIGRATISPPSALQP